MSTNSITNNKLCTVLYFFYKICKKVCKKVYYFTFFTNFTTLCKIRKLQTAHLCHTHKTEERGDAIDLRSLGIQVKLLNLKLLIMDLNLICHLSFTVQLADLWLHLYVVSLYILIPKMGTQLTAIKIKFNNNNCNCNM